MKEQEGERRKRQSEFLRGSGLAWTSWNTHTVTGRGEEGAHGKRESEWEKDEEDGEEEYRAPARDRLQHAGFDHMAPPSAGNTKPCDYPKHTGSDWVSEPAQHRFPLSCSVLCGTCVSAPPFCRVYSPVHPPRPEKHLSCALSPWYNWFVCYQKNFNPKAKKFQNLLTCSGLSRQLDIQFNQQGTWKIFSVVFSLNLTSYEGRQGKPRCCSAKKIFGISCSPTGNFYCLRLALHEIWTSLPVEVNQDNK